MTLILTRTSLSEVLEYQHSNTTLEHRYDVVLEILTATFGPNFQNKHLLMVLESRLQTSKRVKYEVHASSDQISFSR